MAESCRKLSWPPPAIKTSCPKSERRCKGTTIEAQKKEKEHTRVRTKDCNRNLLGGEHADAQLFPVSSGSPRRTPEQGSRNQTMVM